MSEKKTPIEQALDLFVYAPLGLALVARDELPRLIDKGRQQLTGQVTMARMMGEYAVQEGQKRGAKLVEQAQERLAGDRGRPATNGSSAAAATAPAAAPTPNPPPPAAAPPETVAAPAPAPPGVDLAIPGYDTLSASQVVTRLAGLSSDELEAVRAYELATRHRKTILSRVAQLQAS